MELDAKGKFDTDRFFSIILLIFVQLAWHINIVTNIVYI